MTVSPNNSNLDDELLSAYIDGELTDAERAVVETRLESDPAARELVAEMRSLSGAMKSLPRESLAEDLRGAVLRQIGASQVSLPPTKLSMVHRLVWPAIAIAAALMLMFVQDSQDRQVDEVAKVEVRAAERRDRELAGEAGAAFEAPADESTTPEAAAPPAAPAPTTGDDMLAADADALPAESAARAVLGDAVNEPAIAARRMTEAIEASDAELEGVVHLTLTDFREGADRFNQLLISNGVELVDQTPAPASVAAPAAAAPTNDTFAAQADAGTMATRSAAPMGGVGGAAVPTSPVEGTDLEADMPPAEPEMVLVEAPPKQIEQILYGCAQDTEAIAEVTVDPTASGVNSAPTTQRFLEYQQYSRSSATPALGTQYHVTPQQQVVIAALNSLPKQAAVEPNAEDQQQEAWAARLYTEQPVAGEQLNWQYNQYRNQYFDNRAQQQAVMKGESSEMLQELAKEKTTTEQPLRVLFLLHPSTEAAKK